MKSQALKQAWVIWRQGTVKTWSEACKLGWRRAKTPARLREMLKNSVVSFRFVKKNGELRLAMGTTDLNRIPSELHPKTNRPVNNKSVNFFDVEKQAWRSVSVNSELVID